MASPTTASPPPSSPPPPAALRPSWTQWALAPIAATWRARGPAYLQPGEIRDLDSAAERSASNRRLWMTELQGTIGPRTLSQVKLVGTHNSATHTIRAASCGGTHPGAAGAIEWLSARWYTKRMTLAVTAPWAQCQRHGIRRQLEDGVRYLDLRVGVRSALGAAQAQPHHNHQGASSQVPPPVTETAGRSGNDDADDDEPSSSVPSFAALPPTDVFAPSAEVPPGARNDDEAVAAACGATDGDTAEPLSPPGAIASPTTGPASDPPTPPALPSRPDADADATGTPTTSATTTTTGGGGGGGAEELWTCHTVWGCTLAGVVADIAAFFASLPAGHAETLVIDIQKSFGFTSPAHDAMLQAALRPLARYCIVAKDALRTPLAALWAASPERRILIVHHDAEVAQRSPVVVSPRQHAVVSEWMKTRDVRTLCTRLGRMLNGQAADGTPSATTTVQAQGQLCVTQGILTPTEWDVAAAALAGVPRLVFRSIADMAAAANPHVIELWQTHTPQVESHAPLAASSAAATEFPPPAGVPDRRNILLLDYYDIGASPLNGLSAVDSCIALNRPRA